MHGGRRAAAMIEPGPAGAGIIFRRAELKGAPLIPARPEMIVPSERCTAIGRAGVEVRTIEHVLAALSLAGVDNAIVNVMSDELPGMDGSALPFLDAISEAGSVEQEAERIQAVLTERAELSGDGTNPWRITADPAPELSFEFMFRGPGPLDGRAVSYRPGDEAAGLAGARTFCYEREIKAIRAAGLGKGGSDENVLVLRDDGTFLNTARSEDEPVRHKLLDLIGDMRLAGTLPPARIMAEGSGHRANAEFIRIFITKIKKPEEPSANA